MLTDQFLELPKCLCCSEVREKDIFIIQEEGSECSSKVPRFRLTCECFSDRKFDDTLISVSRERPDISQ